MSGEDEPVKRRDDSLSFRSKRAPKIKFEDLYPDPRVRVERLIDDAWDGSEQGNKTGE